MTRQERETQGLLLAELRLLRAAVELSQQANVGAAWDLGRLRATVELKHDQLMSLALYHSKTRSERDAARSALKYAVEERDRLRVATGWEDPALRDLEPDSDEWPAVRCILVPPAPRP